MIVHSDIHRQGVTLRYKAETAGIDRIRVDLATLPALRLPNELDERLL